MGSADFGIPALEGLVARHTVRAVVTTPAKPQGRGLHVRESPVAVFARERGIGPILIADDLKSPEFAASLAAFKADMFVVVAFRILPEALFSIPPLGTVNIHASLLPKFRGPAPIQRAIEAGEQETGITVFRIDAGIDTGHILLQKQLSIGPVETAPELYVRLGTLGAEGLLEVLDKMESGALPAIAQRGSAIHAPKLKKAEAQIDWHQPARTIFNKIRAFKPFPGTYTFLDNRRLSIEWAEALDAGSAGEAGVVKNISENGFDISCSPGLLRVLEVKPEGRRKMSAHEFLLGNKLAEGTRLIWTPGQ
jgi:methionyl-tRNA formyltransferase